MTHKQTAGRARLTAFPSLCRFAHRSALARRYVVADRHGPVESNSMTWDNGYSMTVNRAPAAPMHCKAALTGSKQRLQVADHTDCRAVSQPNTIWTAGIREMS